MLVDCLKSVPDQPGLVPKELGDKVKRMIINKEVLESISVEDKNGTKCNLFGFKDEDLLELQSEALTPEEKLCLKSAVNKLLQTKCKAFQDKQSKIEKECKLLKRQKPEGCTSHGVVRRMDKNLNLLNKIAEKMELYESLLQSVSELQQKYVEVEDKWKAIFVNTCENIEAKLEVANAEARVLKYNVTQEVCSENANFLKALEILQSLLEKEILSAEHELHTLSESLKKYEEVEKDPEFQKILKMYIKYMKRHKHLKLCLETANKE